MVETGPGRRSSTGQLLRPRSSHRGSRTTTVVGSGRGRGPGAQNGWRGQTGGKKTPGIIDAIGILLEHDTAGDPIPGLKWTRKTTENDADLLQRNELPVPAKQ